MRVAQIGVGRIGESHARSLAAMPVVTELLVADVDLARAHQVAAAIGAMACETIEQAIDRADAIAIAASTEAHPGLVRACVERGLPVFVEKPLATDLATSIELVEMIERRAALVQVGFQRRFDAAYLEARRMVVSGELGRLYLIKLDAHDMTPPSASYTAVAGGLFHDSSIHDFDLVRWLSGEAVEEIYANGATLIEPATNREEVDTAGAVMRLAGGALAILAQTRHDPLGYDVRTELLGSRDSVAMGLSPRTPVRSLEDGVPAPVDPWESFLTRFAPAYQAELEAFIRVAAGEVESPCTARDDLEALRIAVAATRSLAQHRPVRLQEIPG
jgi:myo-inositol 2-dehydrogenase/D-chiro-inositol 1-dehydrogenase